MRSSLDRDEVNRAKKKELAKLSESFSVNTFGRAIEERPAETFQRLCRHFLEGCVVVA